MMPSSPAKSGGKKRGRGRPSGSRARKKQKRLDAIFDKPLSHPSSSHFLDPSDDDHGLLRRSSRVRRVPEVLDSSPVPSNRKNKPKPSDSPKKKKGRERTEGDDLAKRKSLSFQEKETGLEVVETAGWRSRLRSRVRKGRGKAPFLGNRKISHESDRVSRKEKEGLKPDSRRKRRRKRASSDEVSEGVEEIGIHGSILISTDKEGDDVEKISKEHEVNVASASKVGSEPEKELETSRQIDKVREEAECITTGQQVEPIQELEKVGDGDQVATHSDENLNSNALESENILKGNDLTPPLSEDKLSKSRMKEGRRCGLCWGGTDGKPPKKLIRESVDSDNEAYEGSSASEEPNYDVWDGFGDEPGWLGRLLGPIHDRFGIARVWVHQHCAVWSPEVYFAGLGCLKNVRAALCRGRALKCSRCGRPGATIGCRVDRCPKTYHLPCSRADGCIFDHRKFLIACNDHRHLFQPQGINYAHQIRRRKAKKLKLELRKLSNDAWRKDLEAEEKWLENCGEDEEFLKREGKRLHRDILRIAPTYIGGSSENGKLYQGWESVAGLQEVIQCLKEVVILPLLYPDFFSNLGLTPPRGVLLHGYPGTGKTLVVRALIGACSRGDKRIAYFARKGADCLGKYVGDAERQLRLLFQVAEKSQPSIIFFDEIDGLAPRRSRHQDQTHSSVVSTLLSLLDGLKSRGSVIVIGATNRPEAVDPALRRPGRFDREIYFPLPSEKDRSAILSLHTQSWPNPVSGSLLSWIANQTFGYAGADLQALCTQAAMNALKRNCALQELLSSAEKGSVHGRLPSLPSLIVEERDWLAALALAPPPCSRREAGMAANDVVSSPLPTHLSPCLLHSLSQLLISFYNDERVWLPPVLFKASKSIKRVIISALEQKRVSIAFWWSHLHYLSQEPYVVNEIEKILSRYGLVIGPAIVGHSYVSDDDNDDHEKFDSFRLKHSGANIHSKTMQKCALKWGNSWGFRALISGTPRSGQQHLASCLLHGFMGHIEIQKVNLATISQEGHGDTLRGLTQILSKCLNVGRCIIYMPRIELWAINDNLGQDVEESHTTSMTYKSSPTAGIHGGTKSVSEIWNSFVEQVESVSTSASLIILATCEVQNHDIPLGIRQFFTSDVLDCVDSAPSEHTIPRFFVHIDGTFNHELVINSSAAKLLHNLVQHYVQLVHHRTHPSKLQDKNKVSNALEVDSEAQRLSMANGQTTAVMDTSADSERIASNSRASCRNDQTHQGINSDPLSLIRGHHEVGVHHSGHQDSFPKILPSKITKGSSTSAIVTFGYQILRYPQFAELCWVTSKLREGPCTDINGPWKGWPFNSCLMHGTSSPDKVVAGANSINLKDRENSGVVRGLTAVGLLAYRGVYASVREVAIEVRKVSELLVGQIRAKILGRKDRYHYLRILSQVAYLEDMVNSWAYTFQSLQTDNQTTESNTKRVFAGRVYADDNLSGGNLVDSPSCVPSVRVKSCNEARETLLKGSSEKLVTSNGQCVDFSKGLSDSALNNSDASMIPEAKHFQDAVPSVPLPSSLHSSPSLAFTPLVGGDESCRSEGSAPSRRLGVKQLNGLEMMETIPTFENPDSSVNVTKSSSKEVSVHCNGLDTVLSSNNAEFIPDEPCTVADFTLSKSNKFVAASEISCLYDCCSGCLNAVYMMARDILSRCWESNGRCSTVDDIHDIVSACSLNLLAAFRKCYISESITNMAEYCHRTESEHCACQDVGNKKLKNMSCQHKTSKNMEFLPLECSYHLRNDEGNATTHTESNSLCLPALKFFFRDGILIPSDPHKDDVLHCRYEKLCVCSIVEMILTIKQPLD